MTAGSSVNLKHGGESLAYRVERALHVAVVAMIRLGGYGPEEIVDIVQIQVDDEP